jgi:hypothetical protein
MLVKNSNNNILVEGKLSGNLMHVKFSKYAKHEHLKKKQSDIINACLQSYNLVKIVLMSRVYKK